MGVFPMKTRMILSLGLSAVALGGSLVALTHGGIAVAGARTDAQATKDANANARKAENALEDRNGTSAVRYAEAAVGLVPQSAEYRMLLAQGYLQAGRFASARQGFGDVLTLSPGNAKAALNLSLTQIATGDWQAARTTLGTYASIIPASDRGLALSLAGDTQQGIAVLTEVARSGESNAKVRQNLALSLALAGQWQAARVVASADMSPADVDARLEYWAGFARPASASDQVASLLGVHAVADGGQPVALALNVKPGMSTQDVASVGPTAPATVDPAVEIAPPAPEMVAQAVPEATPAARAGFAKVVFGPRHEVVQALPTMLLRPAQGPMKLALARPATNMVGNTGGMRSASAAFAVKAAMAASAPAKGNFYVQLGAFENASVAKDAWGRATRRFAALNGHQPTGMDFKLNGDAFYRLSVGGFTRGEADAMCRQYRAKGGACFVRAGAGDQMAQWLKTGGVQLASR